MYTDIKHKIEKYIPLLKYAFLIAAYGYLGYMLWQVYRRGDAAQLWQQWQQSSVENLLFFVPVVVLLPFNWLAESRKWQLLLKGVTHISLPASLRSVLGGSAAAFLTPNRLGEFPARSLFLPSPQRVQAVLRGFVGSLAQSIVTLSFGLLALSVAFLHWHTTAFYLAPLLLLLMLGFYLFLPEISVKLSSSGYLSRFTRRAESFSLLSKTLLLRVLLVSALRYALYCVQLFCLLRCFGVELTAWQGTVGIAVNYLFVTFTPSIGLSEGVARSSIATLIFSTFSANVVGIAVAGIALWLINFVLPMLLGTLLFTRKKLN